MRSMLKVTIALVTLVGSTGCAPLVARSVAHGPTDGEFYVTVDKGGTNRQVLLCKDDGAHVACRPVAVSGIQE